MGSVTMLWEHETQRHPWDKLEAASGTARGIPEALRRLLRAETYNAADQAYWEIENTAFVQGQLFGSALAVVSVLMAALAEGVPAVSEGKVLDLLYQICAGESHQESAVSGLREECQRRAREGIWSLYALLVQATGGHRDAVHELLSLVDDDPGRLAALEQAK